MLDRASQHIADDIEIFDIEITDGWVAREVKTLAECDDAFAYLTAAIASIEYQIDMEAIKPLAVQRLEWSAKAKAALRFKRAGLAIITQRRGVINEQLRNDRAKERDRQLMEFIARALPAHQWVQLVNAFNSGIEAA